MEILFDTKKIKGTSLIVEKEGKLVFYKLTINPLFHKDEKVMNLHDSIYLIKDRLKEYHVRQSLLVEDYVHDNKEGDFVSFDEYFQHFYGSVENYFEAYNYIIQGIK